MTQFQQLNSPAEEKVRAELRLKAHSLTIRSANALNILLCNALLRTGMKTPSESMKAAHAVLIDRVERRYRGVIHAIDVQNNMRMAHLLIEFMEQYLIRRQKHIQRTDRLIQTQNK